MLLSEAVLYKTACATQLGCAVQDCMCYSVRVCCTRLHVLLSEGVLYKTACYSVRVCCTRLHVLLSEGVLYKTACATQ